MVVTSHKETKVSGGQHENFVLSTTLYAFTN